MRQRLLASGEAVEKWVTKLLGYRRAALVRRRPIDQALGVFASVLLDASSAFQSFLFCRHVGHTPRIDYQDGQCDLSRRISLLERDHSLNAEAERKIKPI